jgi:phospholipid/cholesterol/gamma-HCH transport system substrate-binding protein
VAAIAAVVIVILAVAVILLGGGNSYQVKAVFQNASQLVSGDLVEVSGDNIGTVSKIALTPQGQAELTLDIKDSNYQPLHQGTLATVRELSLSGIANRYVDLRLPPGGAPPINNGGTIPTQDTTSAVDLDQIFNTLDAPTRKALQNVIQGSASQYAGQGRVAQAAIAYLNPALATSSALFREINRDTGKFTRFIVKSGKLVTDLAQRRSDLSGLVQHLATTTGALAAQQAALGQSIRRLPPFMRLANTTFVNLRSALDAVKPLVDASKPVAPKLRVLLEQLKPLAEQSVPTVRDLSNAVCSPQHERVGCGRSGPNNDLIDLTRLGQPLANATVRPIRVNGKVRPGAFPQSTTALNDSTPELATARPYAVDLTGWFEGYTHPGTIDANGGSSRIAPVIGVGSIQNGALNLLPAFLNPLLRQVLAFGGVGAPGASGGSAVPGAPSGLGGSSSTSGGLLTTGQGDRCPGSMERGAVYYPQSGFPCNPSQVPTGP